MHTYFWWYLPIKNFLFYNYNINSSAGVIVTCFGLVALSFFFEWLKLMQARFRQKELLFRSKQLREKSNLAMLRKKTGYTFANCKKALELHNNDTSKAETWLRQQAQALGWSKATKLEGRQTAQGLVAVALNQGRTAALVEVNCETDFVARNDNFKETVQAVAEACLKFAERQPNATGPLTKIGLNAEQLKALQASDGKTLADRLALMIGVVGENATLRRGVCLKANKDVHLYSYAHPSGNQRGDVLLGKFAGVVALRQTIPKDINIEKIGRSLCQHIVGLNPRKIGIPEEDKPAEDADDEVCLIYQEFLEDPSVTVNEVLSENGLEVVDFKRFECGENLSTVGEQPLELLETCQ